MEQALKGKPENSLPQPSGLITVKIDPHSGLLARSGQADSIYEIFTEDTVPTALLHWIQEKAILKLMAKVMLL